MNARQAGGAIPPDIQRQLQDVRKLQSTTKAGAWLTQSRLTSSRKKMVKRHTFPSFMGRCKDNCKEYVMNYPGRPSVSQVIKHQMMKLPVFFCVSGVWCPWCPWWWLNCNLEAFAAVRADGRVVTWGSEGAGGNSSQVQETSILLVGIGMLKKTTRISFFVTSFVSIFWDDQKGPGCFIDVSWCFLELLSRISFTMWP